MGTFYKCSKGTCLNGSQAYKRRATWACKHRAKKEKAMTEFLVKWEGYSDDHNTWEPEEILTEDSLTEEMLQAFQNYQNLPIM